MNDNDTMIILCGGLGTRLREVVSDRPKAMALINGRPFLEYQINWLRRQGVTNIILAVGFKAEQVEDYFADGRGHGVNIKYSYELSPLGTGGAILNTMINHDVTTGFVMNGDSFIDINLIDLKSAYLRMVADLCMTCHFVSGADRYGVVEFDSKNRLLGFSEKKIVNTSAWINSGIYMLDISIFNGFNPNNNFSFEKDVLNNGFHKDFFVYTCDERSFIDIGTPKSYDAASKFFTRFA